MRPARARRTETRSRSAAVAQPLNIFGMPADRDTIFSDHRGIPKARIEKRQRKLIAKSALIKFFLHAGERLRCLTTAVTPADTLEKLLTGPAFLFFRRSLLIFTDQRILHIPTRFNRSPHSAVSQIAFSGLAGVDLKGRTLRVRYKNGRQEAFTYLGRAERKKIRNMLDEMRLTKDDTHSAGRVHLCPSCANPLKPADRRCSACNLRFKTAAQALWWALVIPGGGYFFSRHLLAGAIVGLAEVVLAVITALAWRPFTADVQAMTAVLLPAGGLMLVKSIAAVHAGRLVDEKMPAKQDYIQRKK